MEADKKIEKELVKHFKDGKDMKKLREQEDNKAFREEEEKQN